MRNKSELRPQESWRGRAGPRGKEQAFRGGLGWREASSVGQAPASYWEGREWGLRGEGLALC